MSQTEPTTPARLRRPFLVWLNGFVFLAILVIALYRFIAAIANPELFALVSLPAGLRNWLVLSGLLWSLLCALTLWGLWWRKSWSVGAGWTALLIYLSSYWFERAVLWQDSSNGQTWRFYLLLSILWLALNSLAFHLPASRRFLHITGKPGVERNNHD
jgi:hypothetical protein